MAEKNKCCIVHICTLRFSQPNLSLTTLILISNFNWASEELSEILRKKRLFTFYYETTNKSSTKIK